MSNVNLQATAATTTYAVTLDQMAALIAENLDVPVECITVRYKLESNNYDVSGYVSGYVVPGYASQHVAGIEVIVDNVARQQLVNRGVRLGR